MAAHENPNQVAPEAAAEQRKKVMAGVLLALMIFVFWWQDPLGLFTSADSGAKPAATAQARTSPTPKGSPTPQRRSGVEEVVTDPLHPELASYKNTPLDGIGRNIFVYPTPTPAPTPKPLPPAPPAPTPPIVLVGINPQGVLGKTPDPIPLTVTAMKVPADARIFLDGREIQTKVIDDSHLTSVLTAEMIRNPGKLGVQVRSASDAQMYSNSLTLEVAEPPAPPYRYVGLIVNKNGSTAVLKSQANDEVFNATKGKIIDKRWEVTNITAARIDLVDTAIKVTHSIAFTGDGGS